MTLKQNIKNLTLNSCSFSEAIVMAKNAVQIHPEIKTVYFGIGTTEKQPRIYKYQNY